MTREERAQLEYLCEKIATEKDGPTFDKLVKQLNDLLEAKHKRIHPEDRESTATHS